MKKVTYFLLAVFAIVFTIQAQDRDQDRLQDPIKDQLKLRDCLLFDDGTVYLLADRIQDRDQLKDRDVDADLDQDRIRLRDQIKLNDGTVVTSDGAFVDATGLRQRLNQGECLDMDGNRYGTHEQFRQHLQVRSQAMNQTHYVYQDGKMFLVQNQNRTQVHQRLKLGDASVDAKGNLEFANQARTRLRNGECVDPEGNLYGSQAQFRKHAQLRIQAMAQEHFMLKDGVMYRFRNQEQSRVQSNVSLPNGLNINADGSVQMRDRTRLQLRDGECIDPEGNVFGSQLQFRNHAQVQLMARNQEHFVFEDGALYRVQDQDRQRVQEQLRLRDGSSVQPDGTIRQRDQQQIRLRTGECVDPDGNRYGSQQQFREQMQNQFTAMAEPHFFYQEGKLYQMKNQIKVQVHERWSLNNGTVVNPDGTLQLKNQRRERLQNGEIMDWKGERYENQDRFRERMQQRVQDRMEMRDRTERKGTSDARRRAGGS